MDLKMVIDECDLRKIHIVGILIWICGIGVIKTENYFTSNSENFESVPTTIKTYENDTVLLPCYSVVSYQWIRWLRDDIPIIDSRNLGVSPSPRITLFNNGSLQVRNVERNDTAEYLCEVMTTSFSLETQLHAIEVQYPPTVVSQPSGRIEVKMGSVFEIVCEAHGIPQPIISWRHHEQSSSTQLENVRRKLIEVNDRNMAGKIECIATNGVGQPAVAGVDMIVLFEPEIKAVENIVHTKLQLNAQLECVVTSQPDSKVHWFHHGFPVASSNRILRQNHAILTNQTVNDYHSDTKHILIIRNIMETDLGMYECRAENLIGLNSASIELTGRPSLPTFKKSPQTQDPSSHYLIWQIESLSPLFEHILKFRKVPSGNVTPHNRKYATAWHEIVVPAEISEGPIHTTGYALKGLEPASVYEVTVVSRNRFGSSDSSRIIRFATSGEIELNYSTESTDEETYEQSYYDDASSSAMEPHSTLDNIDPYGPFPYNTYHGSASKSAETSLLLFAIVGLFLFH
ncbi:neuronal growth regulator 1 [Contarinia nasturtii]|uniref:neuronal growth regulator 1 n=1 Tax=Contarinia nasturtii TaxID=265458 RepID=UPI0012D3C6F3|nr:neuronal growth regulator 1 [Contarinia nasturtii]